MAGNPDGRLRVELGQVRVSAKDAVLVQKARIRLTRWFEREPTDSDNRYRPNRLGVLLSPGKFCAWAIRYVIVRAEQGHKGWPGRVLVPDLRAGMFKQRKVVVGVCRVHPGEAKAFRHACLSFLEDLCHEDEDLTQSKFLTLAVVGFSECVKDTPALHNLPIPPWSAPSLFRELPTG